MLRDRVDTHALVPTMKTCQRCKSSGPFENRPDGKRKGWCIRCCRKESQRLMGSGYVENKQKKSKSQMTGTSYTARNHNLSLIGFQSYRDYLQSDLWQSIRVKVFKSKGYRCHLCGLPADQVHHTRYSAQDLTGEVLNCLHPICGDCHHSIEFSSKSGTKRSLMDARSMFIEKRKDAEFFQSVVG